MNLTSFNDTQVTVKPVLAAFDRAISRDSRLDIETSTLRGETGVARVRKINREGVGDVDTRVPVLLPKDVGRQLRALAARRNSAVAPIIREWIIEKLQEASSGDRDGDAASEGLPQVLRYWVMFERRPFWATGCNPLTPA